MASNVAESSLLTVRECAARLKQSEKSILRKIARGAIPAYRLGDGTGPLRVDEADLEAWLEQSRVSPQSAADRASAPAVEPRPPAGQK